MTGLVSWLLSKKYVDDSLVGIGALKGAPCTISSIVDNLDGTHDITFAWKDDNNITHTSVLTVKDGETPTIQSVVITGGHKLTFTTADPVQTVTFDVMDGAKGEQGISVVSSNVDENNNLTLTLSNGNVINAGKIKAVTNVDSELSTTSANPVENKVITTALNNKVDKEMGKGLSTEDFTTAEKGKLDNIEDNAQVNVIEKLIVNGQEATVTDKGVALTIITSAVSNLQNYYLKTETYTKQEVEDLIGSTVGVTIEIVEELPSEGQSNIIYFLPTETPNVYSQYIYANNTWVLIGSTTVDLSNYYTKAQVDTLLNGKQNTLTIDAFPTAMSNNPVASGGVYSAMTSMQPQFQFTTMPTASLSNLGMVYQYIGTTGTYTQNMFYRCVYDSDLGEYKWVEVIFHATVTVDNALSPTSTNPVQNKVVKEALDTKQNIMQFSTMPSAQDNLGRVVQYIGTNTANYTNGYFYKAIYDSEGDIYIWTVVKFSADMLVDSALSDTSENPVQNKVITQTIEGIQELIPSEASSINQLVDRNSLGSASQKDVTSYISPLDDGVPTSASVYRAMTSAVYGAYHPAGSKTIAELTADLLILANVGNAYKITEDGVTTALFVGGAGQTIHTGDNAIVVYADSPNTFLYDLQSGSVDLEPYQTKALGSAVESASTVEGALGALSTDKQAKTLTTPVESQTTVEGALGALSTNKATQAEVNDVSNIYGAKNLIPYPYNSTDGVYNAVTYSSDKNGVITVSGTAGTSNANFYLTDWRSHNLYIEAGQTYRLTGCPSGGSMGTYCLCIFTFNDDGTEVSPNQRYYETGNGLTFTPNVSGVVRIYFRVASGKTAPSDKVYPMLRLATIKDNTYVPYVMTNRQMTPYVQAISNPNLLDNPWFTVNQREVASWSSGYGVDRWVPQRADITVNADKTLTITPTELSANNGFIGQKIEKGNSLLGKTVTISALLSSGTIVSYTFDTIEDAVNSGVKGNYNFGYSTVTSSLYDLVWFGLRSNSTISSVTVKAIKLELGTVSTLAMDTAPNYQQELAKCQRYFQRIKGSSTNKTRIAFGFASTATTIQAQIIYAVPMRVLLPTITTSNNAILYGKTAASTIVATGVSSDHSSTIARSVLVTGTELTTGDYMAIYLDVGAYIDFSADL